MAFAELWFGIIGLMFLVALGGLSFAYAVAPYIYATGTTVSAVVALRLRYSWLSILVRAGISLMIIWLIYNAFMPPSMPPTLRNIQGAYLGLVFFFPMLLLAAWGRSNRDPTKPRPRWWPYR